MAQRSPAQCACGCAYEDTPSHWARARTAVGSAFGVSGKAGPTAVSMADAASPRRPGRKRQLRAALSHPKLPEHTVGIKRPRMREPAGLGDLSTPDGGGAPSAGISLVRASAAPTSAVGQLAEKTLSGCGALAAPGHLEQRVAGRVAQPGGAAVQVVALRGGAPLALCGVPGVVAFRFGATVPEDWCWMWLPTAPHTAQRRVTRDVRVEFVVGKQGLGSWVEEQAVAVLCNVSPPSASVCAPATLGLLCVRGFEVPYVATSFCDGAWIAFRVAELHHVVLRVAPSALPCEEILRCLWRRHGLADPCGWLSALKTLERRAVADVFDKREWEFPIIRRPSVWPSPWMPSAFLLRVFVLWSVHRISHVDATQLVRFSTEAAARGVRQRIRVTRMTERYARLRWHCRRAQLCRDQIGHYWNSSDLTLWLCGFRDPPGPGDAYVPLAVYGASRSGKKTMLRYRLRDLCLLWVRCASDMGRMSLSLQSWQRRRHWGIVFYNVCASHIRQYPSLLGPQYRPRNEVQRLLGLPTFGVDLFQVPTMLIMDAGDYCRGRFDDPDIKRWLDANTIGVRPPCGYKWYWSGEEAASALRRLHDRLEAAW